MPPHVRRGGTRGRSNTPRHAAQACAGLSAGRSAPRTQGKFAAFDEFCKRLLGKAFTLSSPPVFGYAARFSLNLVESGRRCIATAHILAAPFISKRPALRFACPA